MPNQQTCPQPALTPTPANRDQRVTCAVQHAAKRQTRSGIQEFKYLEGVFNASAVIPASYDTYTGDHFPVFSMGLRRCVQCFLSLWLKTFHRLTHRLVAHCLLLPPESFDPCQEFGARGPRRERRSNGNVDWAGCFQK